MAFLNKNLSVLSYANGFTVWHYKTTDKLDVVIKAQYFNKVCHLIETGDMFIIQAKDGRAIKYAQVNNHDVSVSINW